MDLLRYKHFVFLHLILFRLLVHQLYIVFLQTLSFILTRVVVKIIIIIALIET